MSRLQVKSDSVKATTTEMESANDIHKKSVPK